MRKAREETQARIQLAAMAAEKAATTKSKAKGSENVAPKKRAKADKKEEAGDDVSVKPAKKVVKAPAATKTESTTSSAATTKEAEKKKTGAKSKSKSKTDDDVVKEKAVPVVLKRRSKSLDSLRPNDVEKEKLADIEESPPVPAKKARGKKAVDVDEPTEAPENSRKTKAASQGKKTKSIFDTEDESDGPTEAPKNSRKTKAAPSSSVPEKRARGKAAKPDSSDDDKQPTTSKGGKKLQNKVDTDYSAMDFGIKEKFNLKITTWNVAGLKALANKNADYFEKENADIICLNVSYKLALR